MAPPILSGLARRFVDDNLIDEAAMILAVEQSQKENVSLIRYIVSQKLINETAIAVSSSHEFGIPIFDLESLDLTIMQANLVDKKLIEKHQAFPLYKRGTRLFVAIADPTQLYALDELKFNTGLNTEPILVEATKLKEIIERFFEQVSKKSGLDLGPAGEFGDLDLDNLSEDVKDNDNLEDGASNDDAPVVKFVNKMLLDAIKIGASDIHFEPYEKSYRIRFRIDGILQERNHPPVSLANKIAARLKVMSQMDISERRLPQDGRIKLKISRTRAIDFRVNSLPTLWGEKLCLRQLDPDSARLGIDLLGYEDSQKTLYLSALHQPQGMILVTGPTGSGKTVSLYTGLNILNTPETNISTAEDPVEINLEGINQVNVHAKIGLTFSAALRAFLRQDPDVVMVGEIRDLETAEIAIKAAQTGHLVLSTLHTNSAAETLTRLRNMGVPAFNIATSVSLIIAQRLARRLCGHCKEPIEIPKEALQEAGFLDAEIDTFTVYGPVGCGKCVGGYKGRVGIYEVVKITDSIGRIIMAEGNSIEIADRAREEGFNDLRRSGLIKVMA
ncbi:MAG: type IV-A pilus assembly ATPase PilB, partial [Pseudomonadota bacterium]